MNGSISPTGNVSVREGRDQTFTITPNKGYAVAKVLIDSKNVGAVKSYTFENVKKNHTIEVVFMKASGNPQTGGNDLTETERMKKAANTFDISLLDHIIICDDCYFSFADDRVTIVE